MSGNTSENNAYFLNSLKNHQAACSEEPFTFYCHATVYSLLEAITGQMPSYRRYFSSSSIWLLGSPREQLCWQQWKLPESVMCLGCCRAV